MKKPTPGSPRSEGKKKVTTIFGSKEQIATGGEKGKKVTEPQKIKKNCIKGKGSLQAQDLQGRGKERERGKGEKEGEKSL